MRRLALIGLVSVLSAARASAALSVRRQPGAGGVPSLEVANDHYRLLWRVPPDRTPCIESVQAVGGSTKVLAWNVQSFTSGKVTSSRITLLDRGPLRVSYRLDLDIAQQSKTVPAHRLQVHVVHYDRSPRIVLRYRFEFEAHPTSWIPVHNFVHPGGSVDDEDRFAGLEAGEIRTGPLPPLSGQPDPGGERRFFVKSARWVEVFDPDPGQAEGFGAITNGPVFMIEHYFHAGPKTYSRERRLWNYFRVNSERNGVYEQQTTLVVAARPAGLGPERCATEAVDRRFHADGRPNGISLEPIRWRQQGAGVTGVLEVIEEAGYPRRDLPVELPLWALRPAERALVTVRAGEQSVPVQVSDDLGGVVFLLPVLHEHGVATLQLRLPTAEPLARLAAQPAGDQRYPVLTRSPEPDTPGVRVELAEGVPRRNFTRGEDIVIRWLGLGRGQTEGLWARILQSGQTLPGPTRDRQAKADGESAAEMRVPTRHLASGPYRLLCARSPGVETDPVVFRINVRPPPTHAFPFGIWGVRADTPGDVDRILADCRDHNVSHICGGGPAYFWDQCTYYGLRCSVRPSVFYNVRLAEEHPEVRQKLPDGTDTPLHTVRGKPTPCQGHPLQRQTAADSLGEQLAGVLRYPALSREVFISDDVHLYGFSCYNEHCTQRFKTLTGIEAPKPPSAEESAKRKGVVPETDPWLRWSKFRVHDVFGGYNRALVEAQKAAFPRGIMGPVTGPMQRPVMYASEGLNPPDDQGPFGFLCYYYYPHYLWPMVSNIYYSELVRIGNRDGRPVWTLGQACAPVQEASHLRNAFYTLLAGGNAGMSFFVYNELEPETWAEYRPLGSVARRFGKLFLRLQRAPKRFALLVPFTAAIHSNEYPHATGQAAYINLLAAHVDAEPIGEEDLLAGRAGQYRAIVLADVDWLRQGALEKLVEYMGQGGAVLVDKDTEAPIPGAARLSFALARVTAPPDNSVPWTFRYLWPETLERVRREIRALAPPLFEADTPELIVRRFEAEGVTYLWIVNILSAEQYRFLFDNCRFWEGEGRWLGRPALLEHMRSTGINTEQFHARVTWHGTQPAAPYDVLGGKRLVTRDAGGAIEFNVSMQRLGGTLVALYPHAVERVVATGPAQAAPGTDAELAVTVRGRDGKPVPGLQCLQVTVHRPDGTEGDYSGPYLATGGRATLTLPIACNDPTGVHRISVRELASGRDAGHALRVGARQRDAGRIDP